METHKDLLEESVSWLTETSKSWSVVAVLIVPMAFAAMTSLPTWGLGRNSSSLDERHGVIGSSFLTLCLSLLSFFRFLSFPGCRYEQWDFETDLPIKLKALLFYLYLSVSMNAITLSARYSLLGKEAGYLPYFIAFMHAPAYLLSVPLLELQFGGVPRRALPAPGKRYVR
ncbi:putative ankyrin repeat-containing protein ITN1 [Cocos nucifera]|nr:putative ankyrin repeat-containing protein ITN1 [Cocos nucifera]